MKIPETTTEKPYIKFIVYEDGKIVLSNSKQWWGGVNSYFTGGENDENGEYEGNTCEPKDLEQYIEVYKSNKIERIEGEIKILQVQIEKIKEINYHYE